MCVSSELVLRLCSAVFAGRRAELLYGRGTIGPGHIVGLSTTAGAVEGVLPALDLIWVPRPTHPHHHRALDLSLRQAH